MGRCRINGAEIVLGRGARITGHHIRRDYDYRTLVGEVVAHPNRPDVMGMLNRSDAPWRVYMPDGELHVVEPGRSVRVGAGMEIDLGPARAVLE